MRIGVGFSLCLVQIINAPLAKRCIIPLMSNLKKIDWFVGALASFARAKGITRKQAFAYLHSHGGFAFMNDHYCVEHLLSFEDVVEDIEAVSARNGGQL